MSETLPTLDDFSLELRSGSLYATINRPETRNALSNGVVRDLETLCGHLEHRRDIRCVILRGAEGNFCAGGDIRDFRGLLVQTMPEPGDRDPIVDFNRKFGDLLIRFNSLPQVTIAIVEGACFGGGLGLVAVCDVVLASSDCAFALSETSLGSFRRKLRPFSFSAWR